MNDARDSAKYGKGCRSSQGLEDDGGRELGRLAGTGMQKGEGVPRRGLGIPKMPLMQHRKCKFWDWMAVLLEDILSPLSEAPFSVPPTLPRFQEFQSLTQKGSTSINYIYYFILLYYIRYIWLVVFRKTSISVSLLCGIWIIYIHIYKKWL